ncbi:MAG TPA: class IV adenylate cyclase [Candidatus Acidoferrum sp.]|nr:class IV adenylate cyclase [Candidatus Acidoferrum sp.]
MGNEREVKLKVANLKALKKALARLKAKPTTSERGRVYERNVIFDTPQGGLAKHGQLLRIRTETIEGAAAKKFQPRVVLTFKKPALAAEGDGHGHKVREEIETEVRDAAALQAIFEGLGMSGWFKYEKYRTTMKLPAGAKWAKDLVIELDETPVGNYLELEGPADAIDRAAAELGYARKDYIVASYLALYLADCRRRGETPKDMLFEKKK